MRKIRFIEKQIIAILAEQERGMATAEACRQQGISQTTFLKSKAEFGGRGCVGRAPAEDTRG